MSHRPHDPDRFDWRRPMDYVWLMLGILYFMMLPIIWLTRVLQWIGSVDSTPNSLSRSRRSRVIRSKPSKAKPYRFRAPRRKAVKPYKAKPTKPTISVSKRWVKSLGRYQTTYYNRETRRRTTYPKVSEMVPKK